MKDPWTKPKGAASRVGSGGRWGRGAWWGEMETTVLEQQQNYKKKLKELYKKNERKINIHRIYGSPYIFPLRGSVTEH